MEIVQVNVQFQQRWLVFLLDNTPSTFLGLSLVQARGEPSPVPCPSAPSTLPPSPSLGATRVRYNECYYKKQYIHNYNPLLHPIQT